VVLTAVLEFLRIPSGTPKNGVLSADQVFRKPEQEENGKQDAVRITLRPLYIEKLPINRPSGRYVKGYTHPS
jgi:hypothetical protein